MKPIEGKYLGKTSPHPHRYAPETLLAVPRHLNRTLYEIREEALPFSGVDVWHAYELSFLTGKGLPVAGLLKLTYPAHSPFLVESKSLKLYLNSFNMERFGQTPKAGIKLVLETIQRDLEKALETRVEVHFFDHLPRQTVFDFSDYPLIEENSGIENLIFTEYNEAPHLLTTSSQKGDTLKVGT
jgi:7-cyano-7-deazaguanine reductase